MVFPSSKYYEPLTAHVCWIKRSQPECSWWVLHSILWLCQFNLSAWVIRKKYVELVRHASPCMHKSENHMFLWVVPLSCLLTLVYHLIVKIMRAFLLLLWSVKPFYSGMTRRNKLQYLFHIQDWVKEVVLADQIANFAFALFYLGVLPSLYRDCYRNCAPSYELLVQWYFLPSLSFLGPRVDATGISTNELWCVKSILLATLLLGS